MAIALSCAGAPNGASTATAGPDEGAPLIGYAKLSGAIGFRVDTLKHGTGFDATTVDEVLREAAKRRCAALMLELESDGGVVDHGVRIAEAIANAQREGLRVIAWYGNAFSAASWIPIAASDSISKPSGICGGAVMWSAGPDGKPTALEAKAVSHTIGKIRNVAHGAGKSDDLLHAMFLQDSELWVGRDGMIRGTKLRDDDRCLDSSKTVLNLAATDAVEIRLAKGIADDREEALGILGFKSVRWLDLDPVVAKRTKKLLSQERNWRGCVENWRRLLPHLQTVLNEAIMLSAKVAALDEAGAHIDKPTSQPAMMARQRLQDFKLRIEDCDLDDLDPELIIADRPAREILEEAIRIMREDCARVLKLLRKQRLSAAKEAEEVADALLRRLQALLKAAE